MKKRLFAAVVALLLLTPALIGCERKAAECPIKDYDSENTVENEVGLRVTIKQKKMNLDEENIELLLVKNDTDKPLTVNIVAIFADGAGTRIAADQKILTGLPANRSAYVVLRPGGQYESCKLITRLEEYEGDAPLQYISTGYELGLIAYAGYDFLSGYDVDIEGNLITWYVAEHRIESSTDRKIHLESNILVLDESGEPCLIFRGADLVSRGPQYFTSFIDFRDRPWDDNMVLPDNLKGDLYCIVAIESAEWKDEYDKNAGIELEKVMSARENK